MSDSQNQGHRPPGINSRFETGKSPLRQRKNAENSRYQK